MNGFRVTTACWFLFATGSVLADDIHDADEPLPPKVAAASMQVPDGFRVSLFAGEPDVMQPIGFCVDDRARLWVAEAYNYPKHGTEAGDRIVILEDSDGDGRHDKRTVFYDKLNYVTGIEVGFGGVWVMSPPCFYFIADRDGDDRPDGEPTVLLDGFGNHANAHNLANGFAWGPDGWLYGTHGRTNWSNIGKPGIEEKDRIRFDGGVYRYHPTRHAWEPFADGTTNPWGIDWNDLGHAFVCNCVNPHLFQVIQGAHYEPWRGRKSSQFAYERIDTIADHLHFVGLSNVRSGIGSDAEDSAGGGHAHCGTMIYLGDSFPPQYRNQLFTNNIHGRRINNDLLKRSGSGYVAAHGPDFLRSKDPWFMGVTLAYGPGGEVYVSDWSDTGECHSTRNTRRQTGRIYRITYLKTRIDRVDMAGKANSELVELQLHDNDWFVRHARRLLQERSVADDDMTDVHRRLELMFQKQTLVPKKLRALWALSVTGGVSERFLLSLLDSPNTDEAVRFWAIQLLCEDGSPPADALDRFEEIARKGDSPLVRLAIASGLQRLTLADRWSIAEALASRGEDRDDQNLPAMVWYAIEPLVEDDLLRYSRLATTASLPNVRVNVARRIASSERSDQGLELLSERLVAAADDARADVLSGILLGLEGRRRADMPNSWRAAYGKLASSEDPQVREQAIRLALVFDDAVASASLKNTVAQASSEPALRKSAIAALVGQKVAGFEQTLLSLLDDRLVRESAIRGLAAYQSPMTAEAILKHYESYNAAESQAAIQTLTSRESWAKSLLDAVEAGRVPAQDLTAFTARQLRSFENDEISTRLKAVWGEVRETPKDRAKEIAQLKKWLTRDVIGQADLSIGEQLFKKQCGNCHRFFGEGGKIGPDITGAQRTNLDYLLENIVDPSATVAKDFHMQVIQTTDGRIVTGMIESEDEQAVTVVTINDRIVIPQDEIEARKPSAVSIMPTGLLQPMGDDAIRDLIGYLQK